MDRNQLAHEWAHQVKSKGSASNFFYEGPRIYSYGSHFEVGRLVEVKGKTIALITTYGYSSSTAAHINSARSAVSHMLTFDVPLYSRGCDEKKLTPSYWFRSYKDRIEKAKEIAGKCRVENRGDRLADVLELYEEANNLAEVFGLKSRYEVPSNLASEIASSAEITRQKNAEKQAKIKAKVAAELDEWRDHENESLAHAYDISTAYLRISGDEVETSKGARVPLEHAERAYRIMEKLHERHEEYRRNGHAINVGHYGIDSMDAAGLLKIGCHNIPWSEIEWLAQAAGWNKVA